MLVRNDRTAEQRVNSVPVPVVVAWIKENKPELLTETDMSALVIPKQPIISKPKRTSPKISKSVNYGTQQYDALQLLKKGTVRGDGFENLDDRWKFTNSISGLRAKGYNITTQYETVKGLGRVGIWTLEKEKP